MARILLIDDQPDLLFVMHKALTNARHRVTAVSNGQSVLDGSTGVDFDLVVTDMIMPGAEGAETLNYLRRRNPRINVIAISGGGRIPPSFHLRLASSLGALVTLEKPFSLWRLVETVEQVLRQNGQSTGSVHTVPDDSRPGVACRCHG